LYRNRTKNIADTPTVKDAREKVLPQGKGDRNVEAKRMAGEHGASAVGLP
jgi:hypothetical protein